MQEVLKQAIEKYGIDNQLDMVIEECSELIQAIQKLKREKFSIYNGELPKSKSIKQVLVYHSLCSEVADVRIMLKQLDIILNKECIDIAEERKVNRLKLRLENGNNTKTEARSL